MRSTTHVRYLIGLLTAVLLGTGGLSALPAPPAGAAADQDRAADRQTAQRGRCSIPRCWQAISFNTRTGYSGWAPRKRGLSTKAAAVRSAVRACKGRAENRRFRRACASPNQKDTYVRNGCVAVAFRRHNGRIVEWRKGKADDEITAKRRARRAVRGAGREFLSAFVCTRRRN